MQDKNIKRFKKLIRKRRAISSNMWENGSINDSEEDKNKSKNSVKSYHRKTTSFYFYGSYLSSNLENDLLNNLNIDEVYNGQNVDESKKENEKKFINSINNLNQNTNQDNNYEPIYNVSFHSYELDNSNSKSNTNSPIIKKDKNQNDCINNIENGNNIICTNNTDENENGKNNILLNEKENNKFNSEKSFLSFKNNLKYIKDKEERATQSYLLALGMTTKQNKKEEKEQYLPTSSVIEEEKSDLIESKSEFSNKKRNIKNNYCFDDSLNINYNLNKVCFIKKDNKLKIKNISENNNYNNDNIICNGKDNENEKEKEKEMFINVNRNKKKDFGKRNENSFKDEKLSLKMSIALNEIINRNNKKEENKRKYLKKNKTILLNSFFNLTYKGRSNKINDIIYNDEKIINNKDSFKKTENNNIQEKKKNKEEKIFPYFQKRKTDYSYISNLFKKRFNTENSDPKRTFKNNILKNKENSNIIQRSENRIIKYNNLNNSINSNINNKNSNTFIKEEKTVIKSSRPLITKIEYKLRSKIPHLRQKIIEKKEISNKNSDINNYKINKIKTAYKNYPTKIVNIPHKKHYSFTKDKIFFSGKDDYNKDSLKQIKTINEALALIRMVRINSKKKAKIISKNNKNKNSNSSSFNGATRSNSKSSRSKENKIIFNKANSSSLNYRNDLYFNISDDMVLNISNKKETIIVLSEYLLYSKSYIKSDVLEKIVKTFNSDNSFFIVFCEKNIKNDNSNKNSQNNFTLLFKSLMKYYQNQNRFIKIYGDESAPNVISIKNIDINKYFIYQSKNIKKEYKNKENNDISLYFEIINELRFTSNAIVLSKK